MVKSGRVVVAGGRGVGKTCALQQLALCRDATAEAYETTLDDTYSVQVWTEETGKEAETLWLHDTAGLEGEGSGELRRPYLLLADAVLLVYDVGDAGSFALLHLLRASLQRHMAKEKKDLPIVVLGSKADEGRERQVEAAYAQSWAQREKVRLFEGSAKDRASLLPPVLHLARALFHPPSNSKFTLPKRTKEKGAAAILMDI